MKMTQDTRMKVRVCRVVEMVVFFIKKNQKNCRWGRWGGHISYLQNSVCTMSN